MTRKIFLAITFFIMVITVMILTGVGASLWGVELHSLEKEIAEVQAVSRELEDEIIMMTSLTVVNENAKEFINPEQIVFLNEESWALGYAK